MNNFIQKGKKIITSPQSSILSAATLIMMTIVASKILGFIRQRVLFSYFAPKQTDLLLAAFDVPDIMFEVLVFGVVSAAFIPIFSGYITKKKEEDGWHMASSSINITLVIYLIFASIAFLFLNPIYTILAGQQVKNMLGISGGYSPEDITLVVNISRVLLFSQIFFVISSFTTGVLESYRRFLMPALAPLVYNISIILGIIFLSGQFGLFGVAIGAVVGALFHFLVQIPVAAHLGFHPKLVWDLQDKGVRKLYKLSLPRVFELSILQVRRFVWLFLGSIVTGGLTYLKSGDLLQTLPISVFGMSLAKAALPTLSLQASDNDMKSFRQTFFTTLNQILFLVVPLSVFMIVLRVPIVRLVFGASQFDWEATLETGKVLSAFSVGMFAYAGSLLITRAFYALQDTKTPVAISVFSMVLNALLAFYLILYCNTGIWGIALSYASAGIFQFCFLILIIVKRIESNIKFFLIPFLKISLASIFSGGAIYALIKVVDRASWVNESSFLGKLDTQGIMIEQIVVDTRYAGNLFFLTAFVSLVGFGIYILLLILFRSQEVWSFFNFARRIMTKNIAPIPSKEREQVTPLPTDSSSN
ncbi:murein biosynthesis integral membrane protein MurJ [Candidatus Woesebacteria bacterium]|nr:MAG: murein biosynthesis integral membrane protein MurJ [Candidatus Woesebacteria bacterium]